MKVIVSLVSPKSLGEHLSVAMLAARTDLCAATYWVPRCIRPLDRAVCGDEHFAAGLKSYPDMIID
jgi:hypothetical protein